VTTPRACPVPWEAAVAYFAGELAAAEEAALEQHLFGCSACAAALEPVAAIVAAIRGLVPPVLTRPMLAALGARGVRVREAAWQPGERRLAVFGGDVDVLVHRLLGDLAGASRVDVALRVEGSGELLLTLPDVPFDGGAGELLIACQRHFAALPPDVTFEVTAHRPRGPERVGSYTVRHVFED
jgi:hypothetical protein